MKIFKTCILTLLIAINFIGCDNKPDKEAQAFNKTFKEVMAVHDKVMPKMNEMGQLSSELKAKIDTTETAATFQKALDSLKNAHMTMMTWMENFSNEFPYSENRLEGKSTQEILDAIELLKKEKTAVDVVEKAVIGSINNAKTVLGH